MKTVFKTFVVTLLVLVYSSCEKKDEIKSDQANLINFELEQNGITYATIINGTNVTLSDILPFGVQEVGIKTIEVSQKAMTNKKVGDILQISENLISIEVIAEDGTTKNYNLNLEVAFPSTEANLLEIVFSFAGNDFSTTISDYNIYLDSELAYNAMGNMTIKSFDISENAKANIEIGQSIDIDVLTDILITSQDEQTQNTFEIVILKDIDGKLMIENGELSCISIPEQYYEYTFGEFKLENYVWNAGNIQSGSYEQCLYFYEQDELRLFGWQWSYPEDAYGVNAYPEIIYGWKPWASESTTENLPKKISEIGKLVVKYDTEVFRNNGDYNLAFDIWILDTGENITPANRKFELMVWEESQNLVPGSEDWLQEEINTSNGNYDFYLGEMDEENNKNVKESWTYLAFKRKENRRAGTVDIKELLDYLVNNGIVSSELYIGSVEFGNELGNSIGYTVIKEFEIEIE